MRLSRYSIIGIMVALLLTAVAIMPVFGAVTGTISVNKAFVSPGGIATVTVDDADLNSLTPATMVLDTYDGFSTFFNFEDTALQTGGAFGTGTAAGDEIAGTPVIVSVTGGTPATTPANYVVSVFNAKTGSVQLTSNVDVTAPPDITLRYNLARVNTTTVDVTSPSDSTGIKVTLIETGANTGVFKGDFNVTLPDATVSNDATDTILAVAGQIITLRYVDASPSGNRQTTVTVEATKPAGSLVTPASGTMTSSRTPTLTVDFTDTDSGVDSGEIDFTLSFAWNDATGGADVSGSIIKSTVTTSAITNGFRASTTLGTGPAGDNLVITWFATATDLAGNTGVTDADPATAGNQHFILYVDNTKPDFQNAVASAGFWYDTEKGAVVADATKAINTSIGIRLPAMMEIASTTLDKVEQLNTGSVSAADFEIDTLKQTNGVTLSDLTPSAATVYAAAPNWIFLTVPAMAADAKPVVILKDSAGGIADVAGNVQTTGTVTSLDRQAPIPTYSLNRTLHTSSVTVTVNTNEAGGIPVVTAKGATGTLAQGVTLIGTNQYQSTIQRSVVGFGAHSIVIGVSDANGNTTTLGSNTVTADFPACGTGCSNIAVYFDNALPIPTVTVNNVAAAGASVETSVPFFITAAYTAEGTEFGLTGAGAMTNTVATIVDDLDIQNTVTVATVTLDGVSLLGMLDTQNNITFNLAITDITTGEHDLVIVAKDLAGNEQITEATFTVIARKPYSVAMNAGWNLVSFPGTPSNTAILNVLPTTHPATDVLTYDDGVWMVATRGSGDAWEGTLTTIDGQHGYWVNTTSSQPVETLLALPSVGSAATLPSIPVEQGWNLVAVIDLAQTKQGSAGDTKTASTYFTSLDWAVAYTYNSGTRVWTRMTSAAGSVSNGQGVWVWANEDGTLIP